MTQNVKIFNFYKNLIHDNKKVFKKNIYKSAHTASIIKLIEVTANFKLSTISVEYGKVMN